MGFLKYTANSSVYYVMAAGNPCLVMLPELLKSWQFRVMRAFFPGVCQRFGLWDIGGPMCVHSDSVDGRESLLHTLVFFVFPLLLFFTVTTSAAPRCFIQRSVCVLNGWEKNKRCSGWSVVDGWLSLSLSFLLPTSPRPETPHLQMALICFFYWED